MGLGAVGGQIDGQRMGIDGQRERRAGDTADWGFQRMAQGCLFVFHISLSFLVHGCEWATQVRSGNPRRMGSEWERRLRWNLVDAMC